MTYIAANTRKINLNHDFDYRPLRLTRVQDPQDKKNYFYSTYIQKTNDIVLPQNLIENSKEDRATTSITFTLHQKKLNEKTNEYEQHRAHEYTFAGFKPNQDKEKTVFVFHGTTDTLVIYMLGQSIIYAIVAPGNADPKKAVSMLYRVLGDGALAQVLMSETPESSGRDRSSSGSSVESEYYSCNSSLNNSLETKLPSDEDTQKLDYESIPKDEFFEGEQESLT